MNPIGTALLLAVGNVHYLGSVETSPDLNGARASKQDKRLKRLREVSLVEQDWLS